MALAIKFKKLNETIKFFYFKYLKYSKKHKNFGLRVQKTNFTDQYLYFQCFCNKIEKVDLKTVLYFTENILFSLLAYYKKSLQTLNKMLVITDTLSQGSCAKFHFIQPDRDPNSLTLIQSKKKSFLEGILGIMGRSQ